MNPGDIAWVGAATALVMIMTPALGFFYAGLVRRKNLIATLTVNATGANGLLYGNPGQLVSQAIAVVVVGAYSFVGSFILLKVIDKFSPLRVTAEEEMGLDESQFGEHAFED